MNHQRTAGRVLWSRQGMSGAKKAALTRVVFGLGGAATVESKRTGECDSNAFRRGARAAGLLCALWVVHVVYCASAYADRERSIAEREHTVAAGQTLSLLAARYGTSVRALLAVNGLGAGTALKPGQVLLIPPRGVVYVRPGDTPAIIARRNRVSSAELLRANALPAGATLRVGQALLLPGYEAARQEQLARSRWGMPTQRGVANLYRLAWHERQRIRLLDAQGRVPKLAVRQLRELLRPRGSRLGKNPNPRLMRLLARVSDHFGGREIQVISGYRRPGGYTRRTSRHVAGDAIDFRISGVTLEDLRDYCVELGQVGIGLYPVAQFVHLDVRKASARWTDWSGPGEAPLLVPPLLAPPIATPPGGEESETAQAAVDEHTTRVLDEHPNSGSQSPGSEATAKSTPQPQQPQR